MKNVYSTPEVEIIMFDTEDVITTSYNGVPLLPSTGE